VRDTWANVKERGGGVTQQNGGKKNLASNSGGKETSLSSSWGGGRGVGGHGPKLSIPIEGARPPIRLHKKGKNGNQPARNKKALDHYREVYCPVRKVSESVRASTQQVERGPLEKRGEKTGVLKWRFKRDRGPGINKGQRGFSSFGILGRRIEWAKFDWVLERRGK